MDSSDFIYPEANIQLQKKVNTKKIVPDMWAKWREDTEEELHDIFRNELNSEEFKPYRILKKTDREEVTKILNILQDNMQHLLVLQKELLVSSLGSYP